MRPDDRSLLHGIAERETARLRDGTRPWSWWLERAAVHGRRHGYTAVLLISAQWRGAADVRSYEEWRSAGRQVRRGETGIRVLGRTGAPRAVFDVTQTEGLPLPRARPAPPGAGRRLAALAGGVPGRAVRRVEADSVAFLAAAWLGLEPSMPEFPERAFWAGPELGDRILRAARRMYARACAESADGPPEARVTAAAERFFRARARASWVPGYLAGRGFPAGVQRRWRIGYAPSGPGALTAHLRALGHADEEIVAAGLARRTASGGLRDTFRDRAMFAIRTADGAVAGFIGRRPDGGPGPKYLNGPDTALFHKGELLYGLHEARDRLAAGARPVIVEGPLDAVAVTMAGPAEYAAVATCGLALTQAQATALAAATPDQAGVLVALDGDRPGRSAAARAFTRLTTGPPPYGGTSHAAGRERPARLPWSGPVDLAVLDGDDPAGVLQAEGRAGLLRALRTCVPLADAAVDAALERAGGTLGTVEDRLAAIRAASRVVAARPAEAARQVARIAARTDVPPALVTEILVEAVSPEDPPRRPRRRPGPRDAPRDAPPPRTARSPRRAG